MKYLISLLALVSFSAFATDYSATTTKADAAVESESTDTAIKNKKMVEGEEVEATEEGTAPAMDY